MDEVREVGAEVMAEGAARARVEKALGKAGHPSAIDRLMALWPEAVIHVKRHSEHWDGRKWDRTTVWLFRDAEAARTQLDPALMVQAKASRHHHDHHIKRIGLEVAFRRALKQLSLKAKEEGWPNA